MAPKKKADTPQPAVAVSDRQVHMLTHTSRMLTVMSRDPEHVRGTEYDRMVTVYRLHWAQLTDVERNAVRAAAEDYIHPADIAAAVAALEG